MEAGQSRAYYSVRLGRRSGELSLDLSTLNRLFKALYATLLDVYYFQEALGYDCVDSGQIAGTMGPDPAAYALLKLRKADLFPVSMDREYSEEDVFDLCEFLYDHVSKPLEGRFHDYGGCGWHYSTFDRNAGKARFRQQINEVLADYGAGWELSKGGEIMAKVTPGLDELLEQPVASVDARNIVNRVEEAVRKFRSRHSSPSDRRDAVRDLADVLELLRPEAKKVLMSKDEGDLFELANSFGVRHHNTNQKTDYDPEIWFPWAFFYYLATIHATLGLIARSTNKKEPHM